MSNDRDGSPPQDASRQRRPSVTSAAFSNLFQRSNSTSQGPSSNSVSGMAGRDPRRRLSVTTIGLGGTAPASAAPFYRRGSISTNNSDSIDENAVDDEEAMSRTAPTTPFVRRMSFGAQAMRNMRTPGGSSPSASGRPDPERRFSAAAAAAHRRSSSTQASTVIFARIPSDKLRAARADQAYNWSEQLRSRAESSVSGARPSFASGMNGSPPRQSSGFHDRAKSVSEMPVPPQQAAAVKPKPAHPSRPKPDAMQERILKGDFYMD